MKNKLIGGIVFLILIVLTFIAGDAFFGLVGEIYRFLDEFIWAFFAGIIAFLVALTIVSIMIYITIWLVTLSTIIVVAIAAFIFGK